MTYAAQSTVYIETQSGENVFFWNFTSDIVEGLRERTMKRSDFA